MPQVLLLDAIYWFMLLTKVSTCNNKLIWVKYYKNQFIGMHTNQLDPDLVDISQNNKFCLEPFGGLQRGGNKCVTIVLGKQHIKPL
jgi:hypothetical protein